MTQMNIKDPRVHELAQELARTRGISATAAVRAALEEALATSRRSEADLRRIIGQLQREAAPTVHTWLTDEDLYDDDGLPK